MIPKTCVKYKKLSNIKLLIMFIHSSVCRNYRKSFPLIPVNVTFDRLLNFYLTLTTVALYFLPLKEMHKNTPSLSNKHQLS